MILYHILTFVLLPVYLIILAIRVFKGKEDSARLLERFGFASLKRPAGKLIWVHGASVGESIAALTLIENMNANFQHLNFLLTTGTTSSAKMVKPKLPANAVHQFLPIDNIIFVRKFFNHWRPNLGIFFESELWPCLIAEGSKSCKLLLLNACISKESSELWQKLNFLLTCPLKYFSEIAAQSNIDLERFKNLGVTNVTNLGNIKFANKKLAIDEQKYLKFNKQLKGRDILVFASTHAEDEQVILKVLPFIKNEYPDSYFILIPRHPTRQKEIAKACADVALDYDLSSRAGTPDLNKDIYIVDEFGQIGLYYALAYIAFVGGSFKLGGHNILEPTHFANLIMFGPQMSSCEDLAKEMTDKQAAIQIQNEHELKVKLLYFLSKSGRLEAKIYQANALKFVEQGDKIVHAYLDLVKKYIS